MGGFLGGFGVISGCFPGSAWSQTRQKCKTVKHVVKHLLQTVKHRLQCSALEPRFLNPIGAQTPSETPQNHPKTHP